MTLRSDGDLFAALFPPDVGPSWEEIHASAYAHTMRWGRERERRLVWQMRNGGTPGRRVRLPVALPLRIHRLREGG